MNWFYLSLLSIIVLAGADLTQQHLLTNHKKFDEKSSSVLVSAVQCVMALIALILTGKTQLLTSVLSSNTLFLLFMVSLLAYCGMRFYFKSFNVKNISYSGIMISLSAVVSTTLGIIVFNESTTFIKFLGILLIIAAIIGVNISNDKLERNHLFGLIAGGFFGITYAIDKLIVSEIDPIIYMFWTFLFITIIGAGFISKKLFSDMQSVKPKFFIPVVTSAIGYGLYNFFTFTAYTLGGEVGKIDAINNSSLFLVILFEYFIIKDKSNLTRKLLTSAVAITGIFILGTTN